MLATKKQLDYLQALADDAEHIKVRHPSLIPDGLYHTKWRNNYHLTSEGASLRIQFYLSILGKAHSVLFPTKKMSIKEDIPA